MPTTLRRSCSGPLPSTLSAISAGDRGRLQMTELPGADPAAALRVWAPVRPVSGPGPAGPPEPGVGESSMGELEVPVRIGAMIDASGSIDDATAEIQAFADAGLDTAWVDQNFVHDTLT